MTTTKVVATRDEKSPTFGFDMWNLDVEDEFQNLIKKMIREGLDIATKELKPNIWFAAEFCEEPPDDMTTVFVELPLGPDEEESPRWSFTLTDVVDSMIRMNSTLHGKVILDDAELRSFERIRDALSLLAGRLDSAIKKRVSP